MSVVAWMWDGILPHRRIGIGEIVSGMVKTWYFLFLMLSNFHGDTYVSFVRLLHPFILTTIYSLPCSLLH